LNYVIDSTSSSIGSAPGASNAYIALLDAESGHLLSSVPFGESSREQVINDLKISFGWRGHDVLREVPIVLVTGSFGGSVDFDPYGGGEVREAVGDSDIFVAEYWPDGDELVLGWIWTTGAVERKAGGEGIDVFEHEGVLDVVLSGWVDFDPTPNDIWCARITYDGAPSVVWQHKLENQHVGRGMDVVLGAHNQVVMTGYFAGTLDFDPGTDPDHEVDERDSIGDPGTGAPSFDLFVTRYTFAGAYAGTDTYGFDKSDVGYAIDTSDITGQHVHGGWFGGGTESTGYTVDFNPDPATDADVIGRRGADGFVNSLDLDVPNVETAIVLVIDGSSSMLNPADNPVDPNDDGTCPLDSEFDREFDAVAAAYSDILLTDDSIMPRDGSVALSVVIFGGEYTGGAIVAVPWITIDSYDDAESVAMRLAGAWLVGGGTTMDDGMTLATEMFDPGLVVADHPIMNVIADGVGPTDNDVANARNAAITGPVELSNGIAIDVATADNYDADGDPTDYNIPHLFETYVIGRNESMAPTRNACRAPALGAYCACPPPSGNSEFELQQIIKFVFEQKHDCGEADIDNDCKVGQQDLGILLATYEVPPGDPGYNAEADLTGDGLITQADLGILLADYDCSAQ
jgi:hypothetical protein